MIIKHISAVFDERHGVVKLKIITDSVSVKGSVDVRECEDMDGLLTVLIDRLTRLRRKVNSKVADCINRHSEAVSLRREIPSPQAPLSRIPPPMNPLAASGPLPFRQGAQRSPVTQVCPLGKGGKGRRKGERKNDCM